MIDPILRHSYVQLNNSLVHLVQYGVGANIVRSPVKIKPPGSPPTVSNSSSASSGKQSSNSRDSDSCNIKTSNVLRTRLLVFVPGNPGVLGIYHDYLSALFRALNSEANGDERTTILAIGHNNFDHPDHVQYPAEERICIEENELNFVEKALSRMHLKEPHNVELQVLNKMIILKRLLKFDIEDCRLTFVGHSIGCYVILRLLQDRVIESAHQGSVLIHPALENLALTEKGSYFSRLFNYKVDLLIRSVAYVVDSFLPNYAKLALTRRFCSAKFINGSSKMAIESVAQLSCSRTLTALIEMAKSEFSSVKDINPDSMIKPHVNKLRFIYAIRDHWVNSNNRKLLKQLYPGIYMEEQNSLHAFVMDPETVVDYAAKTSIFVEGLIEKTNNR